MVAAAILVGHGGCNNGVKPQGWDLYNKPVMPAQPTITLLDPHRVRRLIRGPSRSNGTPRITDNGSNKHVNLSSIDGGGVIATKADGSDVSEVERLLALNTEELINHTLRVKRERLICPNVSNYCRIQELNLLVVGCRIDHRGEMLRVGVN